MSAATLEAPEPRMQWRSQATERLGTITLETAGNSGRPLTDIYSRDEIMALWRHCSNGNASFVTACNFSKNGEPVFYYRERRIPLYQRLNSSYRSASGRTSKPEQWNAVCVYTQNDDGKTVIGAGDFDAHGKPDAPATAADWERAQAYALSSLRQSLLLEEEFALPRGFLFRILEHTGGGFRLTLITKEYVERQRMAEMLRFIAKGMEVELAGSEHPFSIGSGVAEFMPDWATSGEEYGKPTKLPGSFNPKRGVQSLTLYEDLKPLIGETMAREQQIRQAAERSPEIKKQYVLLPSNISSQGTTEECQRRQAEASLEKMKAKMLADYPAERGRRNEAVKKLVGAAFERMNERHILDLVRRQYDAATGLEDSAKRHE